MAHQCCFAAQKPWFCYLVINTHTSVNSCILFSTSCLLSSCFCRHYLVSWIMGTKCFDMMLKFSWEMICIIVLLRTNVLESCCILISTVDIARCEILMTLVLRIHLLCDAALLWVIRDVLRNVIFEKRVTSQKTWILRFDVSDDRDVACLLNIGTSSDAAGNPRWFWCILVHLLTVKCCSR